MKNDLQYTTAKSSAVLKPSIISFIEFMQSNKSQKYIFLLHCTNYTVHAMFGLNNIIIVNLSAITTMSTHAMLADRSMIMQLRKCDSLQMITSKDNTDSCRQGPMQTDQNTA